MGTGTNSREFRGFFRFGSDTGSVWFWPIPELSLPLVLPPLPRVDERTEEISQTGLSAAEIFCPQPIVEPQTTECLCTSTTESTLDVQQKNSTQETCVERRCIQFQYKTLLVELRSSAFQLFFQSSHDAGMHLADT